MKLDSGIDLNFDGHCDLCGKFVDSYGHHKVAEIFDNYYERVDFAHLDADNIFNKWDNYEIANRYYAVNPYRNPKSFYGSRYWHDVKDYTSPEVADPNSGISINNFLRFEKLSYGATVEGTYERAIHIDMAIDDFELRTGLIAYRGFSIDRDSELCKTFDKAFINLSEGKTTFFIDKGFVSTTTSIEYARFRCKIGDGDVKIKMAVIMEKGQKAMPLVKRFGTTFNDKEKEILLQSNQAFEIISIERYKVDKNYYYNVVAIQRGKYYEN